MTAKWDIRKIYLYLVSFATLMMMIFGIIQFLQGIVNLTYPNPSPTYSELEMKYNRPDGKALTAAEIKQRTEADRAQQRYYEVRSMINSLIMFIVALPVYMYHWRKIGKTEVNLI